VARVIGHTGRFERSVPRRLAESATLFFRVPETDELRPGGEVWEICLRVRLMHALVRLKLVQSGEWDTTESVPINQLHTAAGPFCFGSVVIRGLRALGAQVSAEEESGYLLTWRYVTWLLGVPEELLGRTDAEQKLFDDTIGAVAINPDHNSRAIAQAYLKGLRSVPPMHALSDPVHAALVERTLGTDLAARMGVVSTPSARALTSSAAAVLRLCALAQRLPFAASHCEAFGRKFLRNMVERDLAGAPADYQVA
jgi:hypothetical protein